MTLQYNYFTSQDDLIQEPKIRVYTYEICPSRERRAGDRERYPSMYKVFNNKPSLGENSECRGSRTNVAAYPKMGESVKYEDFGMQTRVPSEKAKFEGCNRGQPHVRLHNNVTSYPKAVPKKTVEPVKYEKIERDDKKGGDFEDEECIDAAAAGFIEWKKRTLQFC